MRWEVCRKRAVCMHVHLIRLARLTPLSTASPQGEAYARRRFPKAFPSKGKGDRLRWMRCKVRRGPPVSSKLVHLFRDAGGWGFPQSHFFSSPGTPRKLRICAISARRAEGLCRSVDSIHVFNNGDGTGGALSAFLPPFVAQDKRRCPRGMSAISFGQFRESGIARGVPNWLQPG